ncbi:hypothetical protein C1H46_023634 [Malus baccata]|uniref:Uncharacterized protein n=1 Tax=Malus baccata TaxID=106549 RepID=A0A540LWD9_MALBA|nr:hypothetical protein C1H46_023634 [Malus baccata]
MRGVALCLGGGFGVLQLGFGIGFERDTNGWKNWAFVVQIVVTATSLMLLRIYNAAANTVLYMYCWAVNGELAMEIAKEFARECEVALRQLKSPSCCFGCTCLTRSLRSVSHLCDG